LIVDTAYRVSPLRRGDPERLGEYWLTGRLGQGGMGVVYLAEDRDGTYVAIKLVHATLVNDPEFRGRFRSEVERARQVPSFCTAEVLDADLDHNPPYLVVEYVDGPSLAEVVEDRGPLKAAALHSLAVGVATALTGIHGAGVIHRDLKPDNVLLAPGSPKVIDFGIARAFEATSQHTRTDQMVGTVAYMAPERFSSEPGTPLTAAADVFAWGCVVGYAGTGRTPFHGDSPPATAARILTQPPHLGNLPEPLRGLVELSLAKNPEDRPTARELLDMLLGDRPRPRTAPPSFPEGASLTGGSSFADREELLVGAPFGTREPYEPPPPAPPGRPRGHRLLAVLAVLLVLAGIATVALVINAQRSGDNPLATGGTPRDASATTGAPSQADGEAPVPDRPPATDPADYPESTGGPTREPAEEPTPEPIEPTGGEVIIKDPLNEPGQWLDSEIREQKKNCFTRDVMRAGLVQRGSYQCVGPDEEIEDDFDVEVTTQLLSKGSCAAIWFHWAQDGGQALRVCQDEISVAADLQVDKRVYGRAELKNRIPLKKSTRVHLVVREGSAQVFRGGDFVADFKLPKGGPVKGQVLLGISVEAVDGTSPYTVTFANVEINSL
jgi:eukaryotic-like serine/threonine-protein kinase